MLTEDLAPSTLRISSANNFALEPGGSCPDTRLRLRYTSPMGETGSSLHRRNASESPRRRPPNWAAKRVTPEVPVSIKSSPRRTSICRCNALVAASASPLAQCTRPMSLRSKSTDPLSRHQQPCSQWHFDRASPLGRWWAIRGPPQMRRRPLDSFAAGCCLVVYACM